MNNNAHFFFYFSGFVGFLVFFLIGVIISNNILVAFVQGAFGCLFFAISGRFLLSFILNGIIVESGKLPSSQQPSDKLKTPIENDPKKLAVAAMNEASTNSKHLVQAKV